MATAQVKTIGRLGIRCFPITIEVDVSQGLPAFTIVGLPDTIVQESKERIRAAIKNSGQTFPLSRITVNLAPADIKKEGVGFDLPIALGILAASEQIPAIPTDWLFFGELGLEGELKPTRGSLSFAIAAQHSPHAVLPMANSHEAGLVNDNKNLYPVNSLKNLIYILKGENNAVLAPDSHSAESPSLSHSDFADIVGQAAAKRALEIAAAGHHNILLSGPPGSGKTLLSRALPSIMPPLTRNEMLETTQIHSVAGLLNEQMPIVTERPFRSPHHSASMVALVGGGTPPRPGEITLAHNGVLFLDEFAELPRSVIEALRQPLEDRIITVARAGYSTEYPAHCLLVGAVNPCPCGYRDDPTHQCTCTPIQIMNYQKKLSGPILDRIDLHITVPAVSVSDLSEKSKAETSQSVRDRVKRARERQISRYQKLGISTNSQIPSKHIQEFCPLTPEATLLIEQAVAKLALSARSYHKVLKVSRTIADLNDETVITTSTLAEALRYRSQRDA